MPEAIARVFGLPIEGWGMECVLERAFSAGPAFWIVTANPEILLEARANKHYATALQQADVRLVDGFGLWLMLRLIGKYTARVTGVELAGALVQEAARKQLCVAFVGGAVGVAEKAAEAMRKLHPDLQIVSEEGGIVDADGKSDESGEEAKLRLTMFAPDLLLVAFGHPKQERWIANNLASLPSVKTVVGVGGTFDFWSGNVKRAPAFLRRMGLEWLWRLIHEPRRLGRILRAVIVFPVLFIWDRVSDTSLTPL